MSVNQFDETKPATGGTDASADLRNNFLALSQGADLLNIYASTPNDKKVHWKKANRVYIGTTGLAIASGELNMANFNSYIGNNGYWAKALLNINISGELDVRVGPQAQYSGETILPSIPAFEIPFGSVVVQRNGSSINNIANVNINDMRPMISISKDADTVDGYNASLTAGAFIIPVSDVTGRIPWRFNTERKRCLLSRTATQSISTGTYTYLNADGNVYVTEDDNIGGWDLSNDPTKIIVSSNITKVRLHANINFGYNTSGMRIAQILKNGAVFTGYPRVSISAAPGGYGNINIHTSILNVVSGEFFQLQVYQDSGASLALGGETLYGVWFEMEALQYQGYLL